MNIENQTAFGDSKIENIGVQNNSYYQSEPVPKFLTDSPSKVDENQFIARDRQVAELKAKITSGENLALISGFGGVGKTTIARALYHDLNEKYEYIGWINYSGKS